MLIQNKGVFVISFVILYFSLACNKHNDESGNSKKGNKLLNEKPPSILFDTLFVHDSYIKSIVFSLDNKYLATSGFDKKVKIFEFEKIVSKKEPTHNLKFNYKIRALAFKPLSFILAIGGEKNKIMFYNLKTKNLIKTSFKHEHIIRNLEFSNNGNYLASNGDYSFNKMNIDPSTNVGSVKKIIKDNMVKLWNVKTKKLLKTIKGNQYDFIKFKFSPDGKYLALGNSKTLNLWSLNDKKTIYTYKVNTNNKNYSIETIAFSPNSQYLAINSTNQTIKIFNTQNLKINQTFKGHKYDVTCLVFSPNGEYLVSGSMDKTIKIWDIKKNKINSTLKGHKKTIRILTYSPNGKYLVSSSGYKSLKIWKN
jgi:WD40 repeat protein